MIRKLEFHPQARADEADGIDWYREQSPSTALRFLDTLEAAYLRILANPLQFPTLRAGTRRLVLHEFPYSIIFRERPDSVLILAVTHAKRHPTYWQNRA